MVPGIALKTKKLDLSAFLDPQKLLTAIKKLFLQDKIITCIGI